MDQVLQLAPISKKELLGLAAISLISLACCLTGLSWGTPSARVRDALIPPSLDNEAFYTLMKGTREEVLRQGGGGVAGRYQGKLGKTTPLLASLNIDPSRNTPLKPEPLILANLTRSYLLRTYHTDEQHTLAALGNMKPRKFDFDPNFYAYGGAYIYGIGASLAAGKVLGLITLNSDVGYYMRNPDKMADIFILGRSLNLVFHALTLALLFLTGRRLAGPLAGLLAAGLYAFNPAVIFQAHIMKPYTLSAMFCAACLYYSAEIAEGDGAARPYLLSGLAAGLAAAALVSSAAIIAAPAAAHFSRRRGSVAGPVQAGLAALAVFALLNPYWLLSAGNMLTEMTATRTAFASTFSLRNFISAAAVLPPKIISPALFLLYLGGMFFSLTSRRTAFLAAAGAAVFFPMLWLSHNEQSPSMHTARFFLPCFIAASLGGALALSALAASGRRKTALLLACAAAAHAALYSSLLVMNFAADASPASTRLAAASWISRNIPQGASIGITEMPQPSNLPPFRFDRYKLVLLSDIHAPGGRPEYIVLRYSPGATGVRNQLHAAYDLAAAFYPRGSVFGLRFGAPPGSHVNSPFEVYRLRQGTKAALPG